jgi:hypothetical protein
MKKVLDKLKTLMEKVTGQTLVPSLLPIRVSSKFPYLKEIHKRTGC